MNEKLSLDMLTVNSVSLKKDKFVIIEGVEYSLGEPWRKAYVNSPNGRIEVEEEVPEPYKSAIFAIWGDTPTVEDPPEPEPIPEPN